MAMATERESGNSAEHSTLLIPSLIPFRFDYTKIKRDDQKPATVLAALFVAASL